MRSRGASGPRARGYSLVGGTGIAVAVPGALGVGFGTLGTDGTGTGGTGGRGRGGR
jgi:hypothetical protein